VLELVLLQLVVEFLPLPLREGEIRFPLPLPLLVAFPPPVPSPISHQPHRPRGSSTACAMSTIRFTRMNTVPTNSVKPMIAL
jgi:hypothetical protein